MQAPRGVAKSCVIPKPTVTFMIKRLEKAGLVKRNLVAGDLRRFELTLTPRGKKAIASGKEILENAIEASLEPLSTGAREVYVQMLRKLGDKRSSS